ncbi:hypothetical protein J2T50_000986 [Streptococcus gallinaceus]|uniref:hypothetical protein n=1 Tax=Streptococcus gallinaceus TaxID=165758 RepID=UPI00209E1C70|nr:hypothetical protein [Streptococcus gallinaceus]MCP1639289.1 hypothetical protein [Streptococcus gallinaceus]MCP1770067.1 hypothetical protein [Streptococcus gallinaceus]
MYKTIKDIITWVENYPQPKANLEQFALDLADQIRQMSFDLPEGSRTIFYSGGFTGADSSANGYMFHTAKRHSEASKAKLSFINDVAENILNDLDFKKAIDEAIDFETNTLFRGTWKGDTRQKTVFGDKALALDDLISEILVQKHAKGDVAVLMGPDADKNRVFAQTELPGLMANERVTHINGIPKEELAGLSSDLERFNRIKAESVTQLSKAEIYSKINKFYMNSLVL